MQVRRLCSLVLLVLAPSAAQAVNPANWQFDLATTGQDVFWTSPTAVTPGLAEYDWSYNITKVEVRVLFLDIDVTSELGEDAMGSGTGLGLPLELVNQSVVDPTTGTTADVIIQIDASGFGHASITNVVLGQYEGLNITRLRAQGTANVLGIPQGDFTRDGRVDASDYQAWTSEFGSTINLNADGNKNLIVDAADYVLWRKNLGTDTITGAAATTAAVPEPASGVIAALLCGVLVWSRRCKAGVTRNILNA